MDSSVIEARCDSTVFLGLCLFALTVNLSVSLCEAGIVTALLALLFKHLHFKKYPAPVEPARTGALAWSFFFGAAVLSAALAADGKAAFGYMPSDLLKCAGFFVFLFALRADRLRQLAWLYLAGSCTAAVYALYQVFAQGQARGHATVHPVTFGELTAIALTLAVCLRISSAGRKGQIAYTIVSGALMLALLSSMSRGAFMGLAVSMAVLFALAKTRRGTVAKTCALLLAVTAGYMLARPATLARFINPVRKAETAARPAPEAPTADTGTNSRLALWRTGLLIWRDNPVAGIGQNNTAREFDRYHPAPIEGQHGWSNVHSLYLQHMVERGTLGLLALLGLLAALWEISLSALAKTVTPFTLWAAAMLPGFYVMNITETSFQHAVVAFAVLFAVGCAAASARD
ncbi:MAG: O-antigen ligase family protein [Elusimicrobiaceae bacterium]|nr:O-antigen ligase family protein [Elusimicrobiaceae bacterium]